MQPGNEEQQYVNFDVDEEEEVQNVPGDGIKSG